MCVYMQLGRLVCMDIHAHMDTYLQVHTYIRTQTQKLAAALRECICIYVCMQLGRLVCMDIHAHIDTYLQRLSVHTNKFMHRHTCIHACMPIHMHTYIHVYVCVYIHSSQRLRESMCVPVYLCIYVGKVGTDIHVHIHTYIDSKPRRTFMNVSPCMYACMQVHVHIHIHTFSVS